MGNTPDINKCPIGIIVQKILKARPKLAVAAKVRTNKKSLHSISSFFISETWKLMIENGLEEKIINSLASYPDNFNSLNEYIIHLNKRNPCFGWAWIRARIEEQVEKALDDVIELVISSYPKEAKKYQTLLLKNGFYWFRQSIRHHLRLGYHTAVSVIVKLIGTYKYQNKEVFHSVSKEYKDSTFTACKTFSAFDLELLLASDKVLWDSASANSYDDYSIENEQLFLPVDKIDHVLANLTKRTSTNQKSPNEAILGCPALKASFAAQNQDLGPLTVFEAIYLLIIKTVDYNKT
jgi:hypothetical protein